MTMDHGDVKFDDAATVNHVVITMGYNAYNMDSNVKTINNDLFARIL